MRKRTKHEYTQSPPFSYRMKMATDVNTDVQSINTERASSTVLKTDVKNIQVDVFLSLLWKSH